MNEPQISGKQDLEEAKKQLEKDLISMNHNVLKIQGFWKINIVFLTLWAIIVFLYPLLYLENFIIHVYLVSWMTLVLTIVMQLKLFSKLVAEELKKSTLILLIGAINEEIENLRQQEYGELTRKVQAN